MLTRLFGKQIHSYVHLFCLTALFMAIPLNKIAMSLSMMVLLLNLLLEGKFKTYWARIKSSQLFQLIALLFIFHLVGMLWSENWNYGLLDIKNKLPLIVIPLIFVVKPIDSRKQFSILSLGFMTSILVVTVINFIQYHQKEVVLDFREMSVFGSHIRLSIDIIIAICLAFFSIVQNRKFTIPLSIFILWLLFYTYESQVITGLTCLIIASLSLIYYLIRKRNKKIALSFFALSALFAVFFVYWLISPTPLHSNYYKEMPLKTANGNDYTYNFDHVSPENGIAYYTFYNENELREAWNQRSEIDFDGNDTIGQYIQATLLRYLNDLELHKDFEGVMQLKDTDIRNIELGKTSRYEKGMITRIYSIKHQLQIDEDPNGHSLLERVEFLKAGFSIFKKNWLIGVGTGDVQDAYNSEYEFMNSPLNADKRFRGHNQFLTFGVTFGLVGLILFPILIFRFFTFNTYNLYGQLGIWLMLVICTSFMLDDTLETQAGVCLFGFIFGLFQNKIAFSNKES